MRKLTLNLDALNVDSFDATPHRLDPAAGTVEAYAEAAAGEEAVKYTYYYRTCGCVPYTQDMAYPECVCDLSRTCPSFDAMACAVEEQPIDKAF